jgi:hypothetical protein
VGQGVEALEWRGEHRTRTLSGRGKRGDAPRSRFAVSEGVAERRFFISRILEMM